MQPQNPRDLLRVDSKDPAATRGFSLKHLTAYSVYWLDHWGIPSLYENVTVLNGRLFPDRFTLRGFPEIPDADATNRSILQMRPKYSGFATSDRQKGVFLTDKGRREAEHITGEIGAPTFGGRSTKQATPKAALNTDQHPKRTYDPAADIHDRRSRLLFQRFAEGRLDDTDVVHLLGFLGLYDHTPPREVKREFKRIRDAASEIGDDEFLSFMDAVAEKFHAYLKRPDPSHQKE
jgi:hypothetical protein